MLLFSQKNQKISQCFYEHHESIGACFEHLEQFFTVLFSEQPDGEKLKAEKLAVDSSESAADVALRRAVDLMSSTFLPLTRSNMIAIVQSTDEIANNCQDVARQIYLEKIRLPRELHEDILEVIRITKGQLSILYTAIDKLLNDFRSISADKKILDDIRAEESRVDVIEAALHARIFELDISLCEKIYYRDLVADICQISDTIEDISDRIQVMIVEREV